MQVEVRRRDPRVPHPGLHGAGIHSPDRTEGGRGQGREDQWVVGNRLRHALAAGRSGRSGWGLERVDQETEVMPAGGSSPEGSVTPGSGAPSTEFVNV